MKGCGGEIVTCKAETEKMIHGELRQKDGYIKG